MTRPPTESRPCPNFFPSPESVTAPTDISTVCAPPYDVIEPEARAALMARDPHNSVRLILPDSYDGAAATLARWRADGVLVTDDEPTFSVYRMDFTGDDGLPQRTTGVIGALGLDNSGGDVMPHERTLPKAKSDRLELLRATRANLDPIWGLSLATGLSALTDHVDGEPVRHRHRRGRRPPLAVARHRPRHAPRRSPTPSARAKLVLADGHHRFETAGNYRAERRAAGADDPGADAIMTLVVELAPDQLCVRAIHRLLTGVGAVDLRDRARRPVRGARRRAQRARGGRRARDAPCARAAGSASSTATGSRCCCPTAELEARMAELPVELRDVDSARFDAGVLPAVARA